MHETAISQSYLKWPIKKPEYLRFSSFFGYKFCTLYVFHQKVFFSLYWKSILYYFKYSVLSVLTFKSKFFCIIVIKRSRIPCIINNYQIVFKRNISVYTYFNSTYLWTGDRDTIIVLRHWLDFQFCQKYNK